MQYLWKFEVTTLERGVFMESAPAETERIAELMVVGDLAEAEQTVVEIVLMDCVEVA